MHRFGERKEGKDKEQDDRGREVVDWGLAMESEENREPNAVGLVKPMQVTRMGDMCGVAKLQMGSDLAEAMADDDAGAGPDLAADKGPADGPCSAASDRPSASSKNNSNLGFHVHGNEHGDNYVDGRALLPAQHAENAENAENDASQGAVGLGRGEEFKKDHRGGENVPGEEMSRSLVSTEERSTSECQLDTSEFGFERPVGQSFTQSSGVDVDLMLARVLQDQERAYLLLTALAAQRYGSEGEELGDSFDDENFLHIGGTSIMDDTRAEGDGNEQLSSEGNDGMVLQGRRGSDLRLEENAEEPVDQRMRRRMEVDSTRYDDDESFARALQEEEDIEMTARMMALACSLPEWPEESEEEGSQDVWLQEYDPDNFSYEELVALGDVVGTQSRGLPQELISSLSKSTYDQARHGDESGEADGSGQAAAADEQCVVCRLEFEAGDPVIVLGCNHLYHTECIKGWLSINRTCPMCNAEVLPPTCPASPGCSRSLPILQPTAGSVDPSGLQSQNSTSGGTAQN